MSFTSFILNNLLRQKVRTLLTVLGISMGITTVVALGAVIGGMKQTAAQILRAYDADFLVAQRGASDLTFSTVSAEEWAAVDERPDVKRTLGALLYVSRVAGNPYFVTVGLHAEDLAAAEPDVTEGALLSPGALDEIMLGAGAAGNLGAQVGETVSIDETAFRVVGIYRTNNLWANNGAYAPLEAVQLLAGKPDVVTVVYVEAADGSDPSEVAASIEGELKGLAAVENLSDYGEVDQGIRIVDALNLAISALAVGIGAIGVMNTMVMSVFERTREIGVLRAVGWSSQRILRMIVGEALFLCLIATVTGALLGVLLSRAVLLIPLVRSLLEPQYSVDIFVRALSVAVVVALVGAIYPVIRALRLTPMEALRHE
ncbi:MAG: ABC transporter permease [Dehalococcoidia bacterium]